MNFLLQFFFFKNRCQCWEDNYDMHNGIKKDGRYSSCIDLTCYCSFVKDLYIYPVHWISVAEIGILFTFLLDILNNPNFYRIIFKMYDGIDVTGLEFL